MKQIAKRRNIIIAILISFALIVSAFFGIFFSLNKQTVQAETYNYGTFNPKGYYSLDDVVFYAVKVKTLTIMSEEQAEYLKYVTGISSSQFKINNVIYTISGDTITYSGNDPITITDDYFVLSNGIEYKIDNNAIYRTSYVAGITENVFTLNSVQYTISEDRNSLNSGSYPITDGYFKINGVEYKLNDTDPPSKVYQVAYDYWPTYEIFTEDLTNDGVNNPTPVFVEFGETVLLDTNEAILICYARQTNSDSDDNNVYVVGNNNQKLSASVDFLTGSVVVNGVEQTNDISNSTTTGSVQSQEFGYILNLNDTEISGKNQLGFLGTANGVNNEGLIEFSSNYQIGSSVKEFSFMFYAFKKATYQRVEDINNDPSQHFSRPAPAIKSNNEILEHVTDSATANVYFAEAFYYYANQDLPYLEFDYMRYEISITKTIHTITTTYTLSYNATNSEILQSISGNSGTPAVYTQSLRREKIEGTTKIRVYFEDLGVYELSYKAVYYGETGKVELNIPDTATKQDKLTIYGTQATYQDTKAGQTSFRNEEISSDITGINGIPFDDGTLTIPESFKIASTNQPQVKFLFNSKVTAFNVYYSETKDGEYVEDPTYSYTSNFTTPGFYYIEVTNQYSKYKINTGTNTPSYSSTTPKIQKYLFEISNKAPSLYIYQLDDDKNIVTSNPTRIYSGTYTKNGVQVIEIEEGSVFDSEVSLTLEFKAFTQTETKEIKLPTNFDKLTASKQSEAITDLAEYGITRHNGYYKFTTDGYYSLNLNGAKCTFYIDTQSISGIQVYDVENLNSSYYNATLLAEQGTFATTNKAISLFWGAKESGAQITAKYMRFDLDSTDYLDILNNTATGNYTDNDYILNGTWLASDYSIILSGSNTETIYNKASNTSLITSNSVLSLDGLYIFKLQDEAGNIAYYSVLIDTSTPTVLQTTEYGVNFNKITGINNVSEATKIFFGTNKAISFLLNDKLIDSNSPDLLSLKGFVPLFKEYFNALFENLESLGADDLIQTDSLTNYYYVSVPITNVTMKVVNGKSGDLSSTDLANGHTILEPSKNTNGKIADKTYIYQIYDSSNKTITPTRAYTIRVNTDNTGVLILDENGKDLTSYNTKTAEDFTSMTTYYIPTETNKLYLTWSNLHHEETLGAYVDIYNGGLVCYYYELIWDSSLNSYKYSTTGTEITLDFSEITPELERNGKTVEIAINFSSTGKTYAGMYEIVRTYTLVNNGTIPVAEKEPASGNFEFKIGNIDYYIKDSNVYKSDDSLVVESIIGGQFTLRNMIYTLNNATTPTQLTYSGSNNTLGNDYEEVKTTVFVDRNKIISSASTNGEQTGYYTYMTLFDGGASAIYYDSLYQQSQSSDRFTIQTNKLPVGFYIPVSKYGTVYKIDSNTLTDTVLSRNETRKGTSEEHSNSELYNYQYVNLVEFYDLDTSLEAGTLSTVYSPYELTVTLISPSGVYYYYSYNATNGYFLISGYSLNGGKTIISISDYKAYINLSNNPKTGSYVWETGTYKLLVNAVDKQNDDVNSSRYLQSFYFLFDVVTNTPSSNLKAEYPDLNNMDSRDIVIGDSNYYYTNTNQIKVNWTEYSYDYLTKIDISSIQYKYYIGSNIITGTDSLDVITNVNDNSFIITVPKEAEKIVITMSYEVYSSDTTNIYRKYYPVGAFKSEKTIIIDRIAPTASISTLTSSDQTVKGVSPSLLRASLDLSGASLDTRFNKTITTGLYKYYSFMSSTDFVSTLASKLLANGSKETKYFYYRYFPEKYSSKYETGLALDSSVSPTNVFRESYAVADGWDKVSSSVDSNYLASNFAYVGYYEIIEVDLAGNMTIYTIYISNGSTLNIDFTQKLSANPTDGKLEISKVNNNTSVKLTQNGITTNLTNPISIDINSYDSFNFKNINFATISYTIGSTQYNISYKFLKIMINNVAYLVTPFGFENGVCKKVMNSSGILVSLSDLLLGYNNGRQNSVSIYDTVNGKTHSVNIKISKADARITDINNGSAYIQSNDTILSSLIKQDNANAESRTLALIIKENDGASLKLNPNSLVIYEINSSLTNGYEKYEYSTDSTNQILRKQVVNSSLGYTTYYYYVVYNDATFKTSTFYVVFKDNFGNEYTDNYVQYNTTMPNRYEYYDGNDLTNDMQTSDDILVSKDIGLNVSNLRTTVIKAKIGQATEYSEIDMEYYTTYNDTGASYTQYRLKALSGSDSGYSGGLIKFQIQLSLSIPKEILDELKHDFGTISSDSEVLKTIYVSIYNQLPIISASNNDGTDITTALFNKEITQSEPVTLSFGTGNDLSESLGFTSKVFVRLRGSASGYYEITSPTTISTPGIYDVYVQNFNKNGSLDYIKSYDFVISDLNLIFYAVVKTNSDNSTEVVSPTGKVFSYTSGNSVVYVPYHYILNTSNYEIKTNSNKVTYTQKDVDDSTGTIIYEITSTSGTIFRTMIAVTVVASTNNILGTNSFIWYLGTTYTSPTLDNYIKSTSKDIFLAKEDNYDEITLIWDSYYSNVYNKITCYISSDDGETWSIVKGVDNGEKTTLTLKKSSVYLFKFMDCAGNTQIFTSPSGYPSITTKVTFIRSVIYKLNGDNPLDNSIYNGRVEISLPTSTSTYYSSTPAIVVTRNNLEYSPTRDKNGNYVFIESGTYVVCFSVKVKNGTKNLNEDKLTFTIINPNDSRWAFNYSNYNDYIVNYIKYNGTNISTSLKDYALSENEINISAFLEDSLGNKYFSNGIYTIKITSIDDALGTQSFEFSFWLNDAIPPITVSLAEGDSTTGNVTLSFNETNLYETIGDCYVMIDNKLYATITSSSTGVNIKNISGVGYHYIQVYTNSGKLAYSYRVQITEPLNTITIILIAVSCVVVAVGALLFFLLRKKMRVR